ncbi:hypothetical protein MRX96_021729 [Rhipicephalus microplus]
MPFDSVYITSRQKYDDATEVLYYQSQDNMCAVFSVLTIRGPILKPSYDIRMKNSSVHKIPAAKSECWPKFLEVSEGRQKRRLYDPRCQKALHDKFPNPLHDSWHSK